MKRKSEIRNMLNDYRQKLESTKTEIATVAMNSEIELEVKNKRLTKMEPTYQSYNLVIEVLEDILEVALESKDEELENESESELE